MGYRSQVVLAVSKDAAPAFMAMLAKHPKAHDMCFVHSTDNTSGYEEEGDWFFMWDSVKWYDSYEEIIPIDKFVGDMEMSDLSDYGEGDPPPKTYKPYGSDEDTVHLGDWIEHFKFIRIGEDYEDLESKGYGFENICVNRSIDW